MSDNEREEECRLLRSIDANTRETAANTEELVKHSAPQVRTWAWRLNNVVSLGNAIAGAVAGAIAGAAAGWYFAKF